VTQARLKKIRKINNFWLQVRMSLIN
jgi:hypothetical protein